MYFYYYLFQNNEFKILSLPKCQPYYIGKYRIKSIPLAPLSLTNSIFSPNELYFETYNVIETHPLLISNHLISTSLKQLRL